MPIPIRPVLEIPNSPVDILTTDDGSKTLVNNSIGEAYHSGCGAVAESAYVFLRNSGVIERLADNDNVFLLEIGFGTGLNFLSTAVAMEIARENKCLNPLGQLSYVGLDHYWPSANILEQLNMADGLIQGIENGWLAAVDNQEPNDRARSMANRWCDWLIEQRRACQDDATAASKESTSNDSASRDSAAREYSAETRGLRWRLIIDDALKWLSQRSSECEQPKMEIDNVDNRDNPFDIVYYDAFSPAYQPEFWTEPVIRDLYEIVAPGGVVVSYCVQRSVKDLLRSAGFIVEKLSGPPGGKRDVLAARRP